MNYNFDEVVCRKHTDALKLEALAPRWGRTDLLPMWVADMDFKTPPFIVEVMKKRIGMKPLSVGKSAVISGRLLKK